MGNKKMKRKYADMIPLGAASAYLVGLFLLVMDRFFLGVIMLLLGMIAGAYSGIKALRNAYRPSRAPDPRWKRLVSALTGSPKRSR